MATDCQKLWVNGFLEKNVKIEVELRCVVRGNFKNAEIISTPSFEKLVFHAFDDTTFSDRKKRVIFISFDIVFLCAVPVERHSISHR